MKQKINKTVKISVIIAIIIGIVAILLLGLLRFYNGYASWTNQISNNNLGKCTDTDKGKDYLTSGKVTWVFRGRTFAYTDRCTLGIAGFITEYYCNDRNAPVPISYNCAKAGGTKGICKNDDVGAYCE